MSDHGWDRFKRSFGAKPSTELIDNRNRKIGVALLNTQTPIRNMTEAGIDATALINRRAAVQLARTQALALVDAKAKYAALDRVKDDARALEQDASNTSIEELDDLFERGQAQKAAFQALVDKANRATNPLVQVAAIAVRDRAQLAEAAAKQLGNRLRTADAMDTVNRDFSTAIEPLAKISAGAQQLAAGLP